MCLYFQINKSKLGEDYLDLHSYQSALITALRIDEFEKALKYNAILIANPHLKINKKVNDQEGNLVKKSEILNSMGRSQEAIAVLDSSIKVFPGSTKIQEAQLNVYNTINDDQASLELLELLTQKIKNGILNSSVSWNFQKYLINTNGELAKVVSPRTQPDDPSVTTWIEN